MTGTVFDLRHATPLGDVISQVNVTGGGYDTNFCINGPFGKKYAARYHIYIKRLSNILSNFTLFLNDSVVCSEHEDH